MLTQDVSQALKVHLKDSYSSQLAEFSFLTSGNITQLCIHTKVLAMLTISSRVVDVAGNIPAEKHSEAFSQTLREFNLLE